MDDTSQISTDLVQVARLASEGKDEDFRLLLARLVRRYRARQPQLSASLSEVLQSRPPSVTRKTSTIERRELTEPATPVPLSVLKVSSGNTTQPVLEAKVWNQVNTLLNEWLRAEALRDAGLEPLSSAIFTGPPGVGKTHTARWIATELQLPLFSLDLTAVMSSRLGQSGANLRAALDFARREPAVLFLDEIDSIAKKRADESDVGELKRLVTIMLQEIDDWPSTSLLLAATNHPELVDPALWRRFDLEVAFPMPAGAEVDAAIRRFLANDEPHFTAFRPALMQFFEGRSFSDIQRSVLTLRKGLALSTGTPDSLIEGLFTGGLDSLSRADRIDFAVGLVEHAGLSQHQVSRMTAVSRDTLRKRTTPQPKESRDV